MQNNLKKLSVILIVLGFNTTLFAQTPAATPTAAPAVDCGAVFAVSVPNQEGGLTFGADALYWRPLAQDLFYNTLVNLVPGIAPPGTSVPIRYDVLEPTYHWGFDATIGFRIPCTGSDVTLTWTHLDQNRDSSFASQTINLIEGLDVIADANATAKFKYDTVDLDIGQKVNFGEYLTFRLFTGVRGLRLEESRFSQNTLTFSTETSPFATLNLNQDSDFKGIGPQFGLDGHYCLGSGFGIVANSTVSAIIGRGRSTLNESFAIFPTTPDLDQLNVNPVKKTRIVPALDANLGLDYTYNLNNCSRSSIVVQAGYKVVYYWHSSDIITSDTVTDLTNGISSHNDNICFDGPYAGVKINL